jgi:hypothetical protein
MGLRPQLFEELFGSPLFSRLFTPSHANTTVFTVDGQLNVEGLLMRRAILVYHTIGRQTPKGI